MPRRKPKDDRQYDLPFESKKPSTDSNQANMNRRLAYGAIEKTTSTQTSAPKEKEPKQIFDNPENDDKDEDPRAQTAREWAEYHRNTDPGSRKFRR